MGPREEGRYGGIVEPMMQWAKLASIERKTQVVPCRAGVLSAVVYSNGDVSVCELHEPLGNLRQKSFWEIWDSEEARARRRSVACKECWCTTEVFLWPSITYQPGYLAKAMIGARAWDRNSPPAPSRTARPRARPSPTFADVGSLSLVVGPWDLGAGALPLESAGGMLHETSCTSSSAPSRGTGTGSRPGPFGIPFGAAPWPVRWCWASR